MSDAEANAAQREYWNAARHWVDDQTGHDEMLEPLGRLAQAALAPARGERILDIGCGTGATTLELADAVGASGRVTGADVSSLLLEVAAQRASGRPNVSFVEADAQVHPFEPASFDGAFSRFGVMFFSDPVAAFANVGRALRSGGRLAFVCWQAAARNQWVTVPLDAARPYVDLQLGAETGPSPFALADEALLREVLSGAGFDEIRLDPVRHRVLLGGRGDVDTGLRFIMSSRFGRDIREATDDAGAEAAFAAIREALDRHLTDDGVEIDAAVWLVTARRS